jgi:hypothetical protein
MVSTLWDKGVIEEVVDGSLGFYNHFFLVPKGTESWRPILDVSMLNPFLSLPKFKMETAEGIRLELQEGEWVTLIDFSEAYHHIPIRHKDRRYLHFSVRAESTNIHVCLWALACLR